MKKIVEKSKEFIRSIIDNFRPEVIVVLGSGLNDFSKEVEILYRIDYKNIPGFEVSGVEGHRSELIFGRIGHTKVAVMAGRLHFYEGDSPIEITLPIRILKSLGASKIILTNAAGGINISENKLMLIDDHLSFFCKNPLIGKNNTEFGTRFVDMTYVYSKKLREIAMVSSKELGIDLKNGVYAYMTGPSYETPSEIRALKAMGADAVGMSTVPEAIVAIQEGLEVLGISCITNKGAGLTNSKLNHAEVVNNSIEISTDFNNLLKNIVKKMGEVIV